MFYLLHNQRPWYFLFAAAAFWCLPVMGEFSASYVPDKNSYHLTIIDTSFSTMLVQIVDFS